MRIKIEGAFELAERPVDPRAKLAEGETDLAGGGVDLVVFDGLGTGQAAECDDRQQRDEMRKSNTHGVLRSDGLEERPCISHSIPAEKV